MVLGLMGKLCLACKVHGCMVVVMCLGLGEEEGWCLVVLKPGHWGNPGFGAGDEVITRLTENIFLCEIRLFFYIV